MSSAEQVMLAFGTARETGRPPPWRMVRMRSRRPVNLVGIGLMADIPDQPVAAYRTRRGELPSVDHAERGAEMAQ